MESREYSLKITEKENGTVYMTVRGRIDSTNFENFMADAGGVSAEKTVVLDFFGVTYISSAGLRVIIALAKKHRERLSIMGASPLVNEIFESTGITQIIPVTTSDGITCEDDAYTSPSGFTACLTKWADRTMAIWEGKKYNYRDADEISRRIADELYGLGVRRLSHVGVIAADSVGLLCAFLAIVRLGAVAVMFNPACTQSEIDRLCERGDVEFVCHDGRYGGGIASCVIGEPDGYLGKTDVPPSHDCEGDPDSPCVMIFTSGSTGMPKGALHSFVSMKSGIAELIRDTNISSSDVYCHTLPYFHIGGLCLEFMTALLSGASICFPEFEAGADIVKRMECIMNTVERYGCTVIGGISTTLLSISGLPDFTPDKMKTLRCCFFGAQPITAPQLEVLLDKYAGVELMNLYGMTEVFPVTFVSSRDAKERVYGTVGKAVNGVELRIRDTAGRDCAAGETGEVFVRAGQTMTCYYKMDIDKQSLTGDGFIASGDLGFIDADGYLHLVGRIKDIIIRGGENIVPRDIEEALAAADGVKSVYVCGVPDDIMGEKVAAAVVLDDGASLDVPALKRTLAEKIARHKIPSYFMRLDAFPLLPNGKYDKVKLKQMLTEFSKK